MIWADYSDEIHILHFKTFISNPKTDEDQDYRYYQIEEGFQDLDSNSEPQITKSYQFKKMKNIDNLFSYFIDDILVQVKLQKNAHILTFLKDYTEALKDRETKEELGIYYQGEYRAGTSIKEGKGIIILKDWTVYLGQFNNDVQEGEGL